MAVDAVVAAVALYFILSFFNNERGWRFVGVVLAIAAILVAASLTNLASVRVLAQAGLVVALIAVPVLFRPQWQALLDRQVAASTRTLARPFVVLIAVVAAALLTLLAGGVTTRSGEFPQPVPIEVINTADETSSTHQAS